MKTIKFIVAIAATAFITGCGQVDSGEAGFFTRWGEVTSKAPVEEGLHFYEPFGTDLITYSIKNQTMEVKTPVFTKDVQSMDLTLMVTFNVIKEKVIDLHVKTGKEYPSILIEPSVLGAAKDALGKMEADQIVANREKATQAIQAALRERLEPYGINVSLVNIANIDYSDAFEKAVEAKQVAMQEAIKEKNNTQRLREVAEQNVVRAEAEAKARVVNSEAEAKAILVKAEAEAKAIELKNKALASSHALIEYETVKTWDGKLPVQMLGSTPVPFISVTDKK
jgi:regulator of protease activity HflC (stomatin/prohibitin superfamily)